MTRRTQPGLSRRHVLQAAGLAALPLPAIAQARKKVTLVYGVQTIDSTSLPPYRSASASMRTKGSMWISRRSRGHPRR